MTPLDRFEQNVAQELMTNATHTFAIRHSGLDAQDRSRGFAVVGMHDVMFLALAQAGVAATQ